MIVLLKGSMPLGLSSCYLAEFLISWKFTTEVDTYCHKYEMDTDTFKQNLFTNGTFDARRWRWAVTKFPELLDLPGNSASEKAWLFIHKRRPLCFCGKETSYVNFTVGFRTVCSRKCAQSNPLTVFEKRHRHERLWESNEWKAETSRRMKEAHFRTRTPKKLQQLEEKGITPLDTLKPGQDAEYRWRHSCGEVFIRSFARVGGIYCPVCHVSKEQGEVYETVKRLYSGPIIVNDRTAISPKELDIYLPEKNVAIEFNGKYWHQGDGRREAQKSEECKAAGIRLLHVWEREWKKNRETVVKQIKQLIRA